MALGVQQYFKGPLIHTYLDIFGFGWDFFYKFETLPLLCRIVFVATVFTWCAYVCVRARVCVLYSLSNCT